MITIEQKRLHCQDWIEDGQTQDSYSIGRARLDWVPGRGEYLLTLPDGSCEWESGGCGDSIEMIDDADIELFFDDIKDYYEDEQEVAE
jgi:hypothetical protein